MLDFMSKNLIFKEISMKNKWNSPEIQDLTISATAKTDMQGCWNPGFPIKPPFPVKPPCKPEKPSDNPIPENPTEELS